MENIKSIQLSNLIVFFLLIRTDENFLSERSYVKEKFERIFIDKNIKINLKLEYTKSEKSLKNIIKKYNNRWNYSINDDDFLITFYIMRIMNYFYNDKYDDYSLKSTTEIVIEHLLENYKYFFNDYCSITTEDMKFLLHPLLKQKLEQYIENNNRIFKLLQLEEKIYK